MDRSGWTRSGIGALLLLAAAEAIAQTCIITTPVTPAPCTPTVEAPCAQQPTVIQFSGSCDEDESRLCRFAALIDNVSLPSPISSLSWVFDDAAGQSRCPASGPCDPKFRNVFSNGAPWAFHSFSVVNRYYRVQLTAAFGAGQTATWPSLAPSCPAAKVNPDPPGCFWAPGPKSDPTVFWYYQDETGLKKRVLLDRTIGLKSGYCYDYYFYWDFARETNPNATNGLVSHVVPPPAGPYLTWLPGDVGGAPQYHQYTQAGTYKLALQIGEAVPDPKTGACGAASKTYTMSRDVDIENVAPVPRFTSSVSGATATFDASTSTDDGVNPIRRYAWDFGDGTSTESSSATVTHAYQGGGTPYDSGSGGGIRYDVVLSAADEMGLTGRSNPQTVSIANQPPVASFTYRCDVVAGAPASLACTFDGHSSSDDRGVERYTWTFGDPAAASDPANPNNALTTVPTAAHVYKNLTANPAQFIVELQVTDNATTSPATKRTLMLLRPSAVSTTGFVAIPQCRLYDTRVAGSGGPVAGGSTRTVSLITGRCPGLPTDPARIAAAALNVTAIAPQVAGHLVLYAAGTPFPATANLNFTPATAPRSNNAVVATGPSGSINLVPSLQGASTTVDLTLDISGYFTADTVVDPPAAGPYEYSPIAPCRLYDSRIAGAPLYAATAGYVKARQTDCGIPPTARAGAFNLTIVGPTAAAHAIMYASDGSSPPTASVTFQAGAIQANGVLTKLGIVKTGSRDDDLTVVYGAAGGNRTDFVIDTTGYFSESGGLRFVPITPCRVLDTRLAQYGAPRLVKGIPQNVQVRHTCGIPEEAQAVVADFVAVGTDGDGWLEAHSSERSAVPTSLVNFAAGEASVANTAIIELGNGLPDLTLRARLVNGSSTAGADAIVDVFGYFVRGSAAAGTPAVQSSTIEDNGGQR